MSSKSSISNKSPKNAVLSSQKPKVLAKQKTKSVTKSGSQNSEKKAANPSIKRSAQFSGLSSELLLSMHDFMVKSRVLEERLIRIYRAGESFFWIGGPGEEAWGVPLGLLAKKGRGLAFDYLHLHYRCTPTLVAMGMEMLDAIRLMMNRSTDPSTGGRNFAGHYCFPQWNVAPVTSPIEVQYPIACGTAHAQKRAGAGAVSIVSGGDAGTAEGDFASCLVWASRKGSELPMLITVQNNFWGISTSFHGQHGESNISDRARSFGIRSRVINGNDPVESYLAIQEELAYIRKTGKPSFIEARVSRLYGHSSASGANFVADEADCVRDFEKQLLAAKLISEGAIKGIWKKYEDEGVQMSHKARSEPAPTAESIWNHVYYDNENADWRKF